MDEALLEKLKLLEAERELKEGLPHLYGWKFYRWAREFFESKNKINLLCAANQLSKSSTAIRKCIHWATDHTLWPDLWKFKPNQFWYLYPTSNQATIEFETKWKQFLPSGDYKKGKLYQGKNFGWDAEYKNKDVFALHFHSGVHVYFKSYNQKTSALQTGSVYALFNDEELPVEQYDELIFRISATDGYFHMVFTATLGQDFWRKAMEPTPSETPNLPHAAKWSVSLYDCIEYEDGTSSHWNREKIKIIEDRCKSHNEVMRRVHGRFVMDSGRLYPGFDIKRNMKPHHQIPKNWLVYAGVDIGSGGKTGHPAAIVFVGIKPDYKEGRVFLAWRGDGIETTAGDVYKQYKKMVEENNLVVTRKFYDWASKDFYTIATRLGESFTRAEKGEKGVQILNVLFKNNMLHMYDGPELQKLASELSTLREDETKSKAKNDLADALRYAISDAPWNFTVIDAGLRSILGEVKVETHEEAQLRRRREWVFEEDKRPEATLQDEFNEWNELYG